MKLQENVSLASYSTMRLGGNARYLVEILNETELKEALEFARDKKLPIHVVGEGSNTIFSDEGFKGLVVVNKITGVEKKEAKQILTLTVGAGEKWDDVVETTIALGYADIAALSKIPGTTGAAPVQNIGAYGQQISDCIVSVRAFDLGKKNYVNILRQDCNFSYRHSRFNQKDKGKFIITQIKLQLGRKKLEPPFYADVQRYFAKQGIIATDATPANLRDAVIAIRSLKLPDPTQVANCGSFFGNPVIDNHAYTKLLSEHPTLQAHTTDDGKLKLYAGQLIELAGMKNYHDMETGMATWKHQSLVVVNERATHTSDLLMFKQKIVANVQATFGITLTQEPEFVK